MACDRHLRDIRACLDGEGPWLFRPELAQRAFGIIALCKHHKGREWAGRPLALEPFQQFIVGSLMGWVHRETGLRRFRNVFIELTRGTGKSTLAGAMLILLTFFDNEAGAEGYSVATKADQAAITFRAARQMVLRSPALKKRIQVSAYNLHDPVSESRLQALGSDAHTLDGLRPQIVVVDEVHKLPSADIVEVMESGMGTRDNPMLFEITTAGDDDQSVYGQHFLLSTRVLEQTVPLDEWFAFIASADVDDDWTQESTWIKANPNWNVSVKPDFLRKECRKALANPAEQGKFRRLYLGQKTQAVDGYFSVDDWRLCPELPDEDTLRRCACWLGLDLSSSIDITAAVLVWRLSDTEIAIKPHFWMPEENIEARGHQDRVPYEQFASQSFLTLTKGATIDRIQVRQDVATLAKAWKVKQVCYDPWHMPEMAQALTEDDRVPMLAIPQRYELLSPAMKDLQALILQRRVRHDHNPLMGIMVSNTVPRMDDKGNVVPSKRKSRGRIDGVQATLNVFGQLRPPASMVPQLFFLGGRT